MNESEKESRAESQKGLEGETSGAAPLGNAVKDLDTGRHGVVERSRTRQSLDLPRRSPNSGEFGYNNILHGVARWGYLIMSTLSDSNRNHLWFDEGTAARTPQP